MTESQFIEQNKEKWKELELLLELPNKDADKLQELFVKVSSDLSYARTFYPKRSVRLYLNNLTQKVFDSMGKKNSGFKLDHITNFFGNILPEEAFRQRKILLISFLIFMVSIGIGALSTAKNPEFAKVILGERYINMTEENINKEDPMAVYKDQDALGMFAGITINNIRVAFFAFVLGILGGIGTVYILISNGIMVGVFQYYFYSKGLFLTSFLTIWIHGTIEILAIIIAGAAGIILGNGLLFPGTYKRSTALQISAKRSFRILLGTIPLFIIAGLLESFVTRLTTLPNIIKFLIIASSLLFVLTIYVIYPYLRSKKVASFEDFTKVNVQQEEQTEFERFQSRTLSENISQSFALFRSFFGLNINKVVGPSMLISCIIFYFYASTQTYQAPNYNSYKGFQFEFAEISFFAAIVPFTKAIFISFCICYIELFLQKKSTEGKEILLFLKRHYLYILLVVLAFSFFIMILKNAAVFIFLLFPIQLLLAFIDFKTNKYFIGTNTLLYNLKLVYRKYFYFIIPAAISLMLYYIFQILFSSVFAQVLGEFISWHNILPDVYSTMIFIRLLLDLLMTLILFPLIYFLFSNSYYSFKCTEEAIDLRVKLAQFGSNKIS